MKIDCDFASVFKCAVVFAVAMEVTAAASPSVSPTFGPTNSTTFVTSYIMNTFAGGGASAGSGGPATDVGLNSPKGLWGDSVGVVYFTEYGNSCVRKVDTSGIIYTIAGIRGSYGASNDTLPATSSKLAAPANVAVDSTGVVYIAEFDNYKIKKVSLSGMLTTFAGNGNNGLTDSALATAVAIGKPEGLWLDSVGKLYYSTLYSNKRYMKTIGPDNIIVAYAGKFTR